MQRSVRALLTLIAALGVRGLLAQEQPATQAADQPVAGQEQPGPGATWSASAGTAYQFPASLDDGGSFTLARLGVGVGVAYPLHGTSFMFDHALSYERDAYDFSSRNEPWDDINALTYSLRAVYKADDDWVLMGGPILGVSAEDDADWGDALRFGIMVGATYRWSPELNIGLGVIAAWDVGDKDTVVPMVLVDWKISDQWRLHNARPQPGFRGTAGLELAWAPQPKWELAMGAAYDTRRFRLSDEDRGDLTDGIGQNNSIPVYARVSYQVSDAWSLGAIGGVLLGGELRAYDDDGHKLAEENYDPAGFVGVSVRWNQ